MPFNSRTKIKMYLGYPSYGFLQAKTVDSQLDKIEGLADQDSVTIINNLIVQLDAVAQAINVGHLDTAGLEAIGNNQDIEFYQGAKLAELRSVGRGLVYQLFAITQIPVNSDYFGTAPSGAVSGLTYGFF